MIVRALPGEDPWAGRDTTADWRCVSPADVLADVGNDATAAHVALAALDVTWAFSPAQPLGGRRSAPGNR